MKAVRVYSSEWCPYCVMAKRLLTGKGVHFQEIHVDADQSGRAEMMRLSGRRTVPQIFVGEIHVGGFDDLSAMDRAGQLDQLLHD